MVTDTDLVTTSRTLVGPYKGMHDRWFKDMERKQSFGSVVSVDSVFIPEIRQTTQSFRTKSGGSFVEVSPQSLILEAENKVRRPADRGHEFMSFSGKLVASHRDMNIEARGNGYYKGPFFLNARPWPLTNFIDHDPLYSGVDLTHASNAMRQTMPTKSAANLSQALLELIVDLPQIPFAAFTPTRRPKVLASQASKEYLGQAFAWSPLATDVLKICRAIVYSQQILNQYMRDSGRSVRRRFDYPFETQETSAFADSSPSGLLNMDWSTNAFLNVFDSLGDSQDIAQHDVVIAREQWFIGSWMYFADEGNTLLDKITAASKKAKYLLGIKLDPSILWELAPWSWLADWFANIGDIIAINSALANDNLVLQYGYFMNTTYYSHNVTHPGVKFWNGFNTGPISSSIHYTTKERIRATPYGFGISTDLFNAGQWAILGALGLTKAPRKLWWG